MRIVNTFDKADYVTHSGVFHSDDVMATVLLDKLNQGRMNLYRANYVPVDFKGIAYDIGGGQYDHHQIGGNGTRANGIPYSSCGLIWKDFGYDILKKLGISDTERIWNHIDKNVIACIDADDNGYNYSVGFSFSKIISNMNPTWDSTISSDDAFMSAVAFADRILTDAINHEFAKIKAEGIVQRAIESAVNHMIVLPYYVPWKQTLVKHSADIFGEIYFVIYPSCRGGYNIAAVPRDLETRVLRKAFPESWRGKRSDELKEITGIDDIVFVHNAGFLAATESLEGAIKVAEQACS